MSLRFRLIGTALLLVLVLGLTTFFAVQTIQAVQSLQESRHQVLTGDVHSIRPWMTIPYVSQVYHVPEGYLLESLHISSPASVRHVTLHALAGRLHLEGAVLIHEIQTAIRTYRSRHSPPAPQPGGSDSVIPPPLGMEKP